MKLNRFEQEVYNCAEKIPKGKISTYGRIAAAIGRPKSCRAVGRALHVNPFAPKVPCHRVIKADGKIGGFNRGESEKIKKLKDEGVEIENGKVVDMNKFLHEF